MNIPDVHVDMTWNLAWMCVILLSYVLWPRKRLPQQNVAAVFQDFVQYVNREMPSSPQVDFLLHVYYRDPQGHVIQLTKCPDGWKHFDLTQMANAPKVARSTDLTVMQDRLSQPVSSRQENKVSILFHGENDHLYELYETEIGWTCTDIMEKSGSRPIA